MLRGRWFGWGVLALAVSLRCGGKAERSRDDASGSGAQTSAGAGTTHANGGTSGAIDGAPTRSTASTGGSGGSVTSVLDACPDFVDQLPCGAEGFIPDLDFGESPCEFRLVNTQGQRTAPLSAVDCEYVPRFEGGEGGAAGSGVERENWTWDPDTNTVTFLGPWCEEIMDGVERIDVIFNCSFAE